VKGGRSFDFTEHGSCQLLARGSSIGKELQRKRREGLLQLVRLRLLPLVALTEPRIIRFGAKTFAV